VIGEINGGWRLITSQLNHERVGLAALAGQTHRLFDELLEWCRVTPAADGSGRTMIDVEWVQRDLAEAHARGEAMKLLNWRMAAAVASNTLTPADASAAKVFGVETQIAMYRLMLSVPALLVSGEGSPGVMLHGDIERVGACRSTRWRWRGGGAARDQATAGLGWCGADRCATRDDLSGCPTTSSGQAQGLEVARSRLGGARRGNQAMIRHVHAWRQNLCTSTPTRRDVGARRDHRPPTMPGVDVAG
jgi:hypothetical protein